MENILPILIWPNDKLHEKCIDVIEFDDKLVQLGRSLLLTMKAKRGIGLAAPQVGVLKNIIAIWIEEKLPMVFVNPVVTQASAELFKHREGCLSVPDYFEDRERPAKITLKFKDVKGGDHEVEFEGLHAFCIQHEIDHLNGKVFVDGLSELKRSRIKNRIKKLQR